MKIENKENINEILLSHKGRNVKFECFIKPFPCSDRLDLPKKMILKEVEAKLGYPIEIISE